MTIAWFALAALYLTFIFWLGSWGDGRSAKAKKFSSHPYVYSFALAIYCTAWTYFGAVGEAARNQWNYLPILLGPILLYLFGYRLIVKLIKVSKRQHVTTIADLVSSRYGKRQMVALMVTLIVLLAAIPYISLQLQAISAAFTLVSGAENAALVVLCATIFIGAFCVFFGTRRTDVTEYRHGLMLSISFESVLKLAALGMVAVYVLWAILGEDIQIQDNMFNMQSLNNSFSDMSFWLQTGIAALAVVCLPRQFHVAIIDNLNIKHVKTARWLFPSYLAAIALLIPIIANAGISYFANTDISPDNYVISLAMASDSVFLKAMVFLGGLSAAIAMIIVSTLTLSTMISNDVILPRLLSKQDKLQTSQSHFLLILWIRRTVIVAILAMSFSYHMFFAGNMSLTNIGLLAFSLMIQLSPAIIIGLYWQRAHAQGVIAGLVAGIIAWVLFLVFPMVTEQAGEGLNSQIISITASLALLVNVVFFVVFSLMSEPNLMDKMQAHSFVTSQEFSLEDNRKSSVRVKNEDLLTVLKTFLGNGRTRHLVSDFEHYQQQPVQPGGVPENEFILFCERSLGGVIGSSSSNLLINAVLNNQQMNFEQLVSVFDDTTQAIQTHQNTLFASLESLAQGISVIDKDLCLVAWNRGYLDIFNYPDDLIKVGTPIEDLVRYNATRGECGFGDIDQLVHKRMEHLRAGKPHKFVRQRSDGRVIEMIGNPLPDGGFVTSFNDISEHIELQKALKEANINLEKRVTSRADEVKAINSELHKEILRRAEVERQLVDAREQAEQANASKTRFLALASHDILQPINSAKLYLSAIESMEKSDELGNTLKKLTDSINAGETLIATLLEIARFDQGALTPKLAPYNLKEILQRLGNEFASVAEHKGLRFKVLGNCEYWIKTDQVYLHRIIRNLISNAIKYTHSGAVVVCVRKRQNACLLQIRDSGEGISESNQNKIFEDFYRAHDGREQGLGLGLAVVARLSKLLDLRVNIRSAPGQGSCFSINLPTTDPIVSVPVNPQKKINGIAGIKALCLDDEDTNLDAMQTLLTRWQVETVTANRYDKALLLLTEESPDVLLVDYQLGDHRTGLDFIAEVRTTLKREVPAILITAVRDEALLLEAQHQSVHYLPKPVKPAKLRALLSSFKLNLIPQ